MIKLNGNNWTATCDSCETVKGKYPTYTDAYESIFYARDWSMFGESRQVCKEKITCPSCGIQFISKKVG